MRSFCPDIFCRDRLFPLLDYARYAILFHTTVILPLAAADTAVKKRVEGLGVVVVAGVAELVQNYEVAQLIGQKHNKER